MDNNQQKTSLFQCILEDIEKLKLEKKQLIIAMDGRCGSGKSTLAELIATKFNCNIINMDDFFLPFERKTKERLAQPGGNVDYERFEKEIFNPLQENKEIAYHSYDCSIRELTGPIHIQPKQVIIVEGVYSLHPALQSLYNYKVFLTVEPHVQKERILKRNGPEMFKKFVDQWIVLEEEYFTKCNIQSQCDIIVDTTNE